MNFRTLLFVSAAWGSCGCASAEPIEITAAGELGSAPMQEACSVGFYVSDSLHSQGQAAVDRWSDATGCDIHLEDGGWPIIETVGLRDKTGKVVYGMTDHTLEMSYVRAGIDPDSKQLSVTHEMGHVLIGIPGLHTASGLMRADAVPTDVIDSVALHTVCAHLGCTLMQPE